MYLYLRQKSDGSIKTKVLSDKWVEINVPDGCSVDCVTGVMVVNGIAIKLDKDGKLIGDRSNLESDIMKERRNEGTKERRHITEMFLLGEVLVA